MIYEIAWFGCVVGTALVLRYMIMFVIVVWSLRADDKGRKHALRLLELIDKKRQRKPP